MLDDATFIDESPCTRWIERSITPSNTLATWTTTGGCSLGAGQRERFDPGSSPSLITSTGMRHR